MKEMDIMMDLIGLIFIMGIMMAPMDRYYYSYYHIGGR